MLNKGFLMAAGQVGGSSLLSYISTATSTDTTSQTYTTTYRTLTSVDIGTENPNREIYLGVSLAGNAPVSITVGGSNATPVVGRYYNGVYSGIWKISLTTGNSADIVLEFDGWMATGSMAVSIYNVIGSSSTYAISANSDFSPPTLSVNVNTLSGGFVLAEASAKANDITLTGVDTDYAAIIPSSWPCSAAAGNYIATTSETPRSISMQNSASVFKTAVAASFELL